MAYLLSLVTAFLVGACSPIAVRVATPSSPPPSPAASSAPAAEALYDTSPQTLVIQEVVSGGNILTARQSELDIYGDGSWHAESRPKYENVLPSAGPRTASGKLSRAVLDRLVKSATIPPSPGQVAFIDLPEQATGNLPVGDVGGATITLNLKQGSHSVLSGGGIMPPAFASLQADLTAATVDLATLQ